jgi:peptide/nickel transport system ATP-binding protein
VLLCDEPTASLDVSVQAQILNLLPSSGRQAFLGRFVSHDLDLIRRIADEAMVMYAGRVMEARGGRDPRVPSAPVHRVAFRRCP